MEEEESQPNSINEIKSNSINEKILSEEKKPNSINEMTFSSSQEKKYSSTKDNYADDGQQELDLSILSISSYDSLENIKLEKMGQYTCDECHEIPKIISTNIEKKTILLKCKNHGQKELNLRDYIVNSLKYNPNNWKCTKCENIQKTTKGLFKFCDCGFAFCDNCIKVHKKEHPDSRTIESDKYYLYCKKQDHFGTKYTGYCFDCNDNFCETCEKNHKNHSKVQNSNMEIEYAEIEKIKNLNREYRSLITYYESLIRLNNLIIHSYEKNRGNYCNLYNINRIISNIKRKNIISSLKDKKMDVGDSYYNQGMIVPGEKNTNFNSYIKDLYKQDLKEDETIEIKIDNKFFNNLDLKILTQIPLYNLKMLNLDNNGITKIDFLENAEFPELIVLSLKNNAIEDISVLETIKFEELQGLLLNNNNINNISVFGKIKLKQLRLIDLRNNNIDTIDVFGKYGEDKLSVLQCIYLSGNKFDINKFGKIKQLLEKCPEFNF